MKKVSKWKTSTKIWIAYICGLFVQAGFNIIFDKNILGLVLLIPALIIWVIIYISEDNK